MGKESFNGQYIGQNFNDSTVLGVTTKKDIESQFGFVDSVALKSSDYVDDRTSLGMLNLFENAKIVNVPFIADALRNSNKIYVNGVRGSFDYEIAMDFEKPVVVQNVEDGDYLGIDGSEFDIKLSHPHSPGDILTYDPVDGVQVIVVEGKEVVDEGDGFVHTVTLNTRDRNLYFPPARLKPGTEFVKIDHVDGEFSNTPSAPSLNPLMENKVKLMYTLGDYRSVQVGWSLYADVITVNGKEAPMLTERVKRLQEGLGGDYFFVGNQKNGKLVRNSVKVQPIMEALVMAELMRMTAMGMMFNRGATITGINGSKVVNEGLYHQLRRGHRFVYSNVSELRAYIKRASEVIYQGTSIAIHDRKMKFKAGFHAYNLVRDLFKTEFANTTPVHINQDALPPAVKILQGSDRYNLNYESYAIGSAFLNGIGHVTVEHDPSLDYDKFGDYIARGYSAGLSKRAWTLVMWDITDAKYSNIFNRSVFPKGVEIDNKSKGQPNLYIVKPKDIPDFSYGSSNGFVFEAGHNYSRSQPGREYTAASVMSAWIPDKGRVVMLEKLDTRDF